MIVLIIVVVYLIMMGLPIVFPYQMSKVKTEPIFINQNNTRNPRYFAQSFRTMITKAIVTINEDGYVKLNTDEKVLKVTKGNVVANFEQNDMIFDEIVYVEDEITIKGSHIFEKEVYSEESLIFADPSEFKSIGTNKNLTVAQGTKITRWVDAEESLIIKDDVNLGVSATSDFELIIGKNCEFVRLHSKEIYTGDKEFFSGRKIMTHEEQICNEEIVRDLKVVGKVEREEDEVVNVEAEEIHNTIITKHNLVIHEDCTIYGSIRSAKSLIIKDNVTIHGNLFIEDDIYIGKNVTILGVVFTQENIIIDDGVVIGIENSEKSAVARRCIFILENSKIHGNVVSNRNGYVMPKNVSELLEERVSDKFLDLLKAEKIDLIDKDQVAAEL